jgi:hypothetical protein
MNRLELDAKLDLLVYKAEEIGRVSASLKAAAERVKQLLNEQELP